MRDVVREATGLAPYERRCVELLRIGADKRTLKFAKKRVCWGLGRWVGLVVPSVAPSISNPFPSPHPHPLLPPPSPTPQAWHHEACPR